MSSGMPGGCASYGAGRGGGGSPRRLTLLGRYAQRDLTTLACWFSRPFQTAGALHRISPRRPKVGPVAGRRGLLRTNQSIYDRSSRNRLLQQRVATLFESVNRQVRFRGASENTSGTTAIVTNAYFNCFAGTQVGNARA